MRGYGMVRSGEVGWLEKPEPECGPLSAVVRPLAVGVCSTDTHTAVGGLGPDIENRILGHEAIAEVVEVGELVERFKPGDRVVVNCVTPDWSALSVQDRGANNSHDHGMLASLKFVGERDGCLAERFLVNHVDSNVARLPEDVSLEDALALTDMMSTGFYGVEMADVQFGEAVVVFGIGPVGLMSTLGTSLRGAGRIICIGTRPNCVELAKEFGATDIVSYKQGDVVEQILALNGGKVDKVILAGGGTETMNQALQVVRPNGVVSNVNFFDVGDTYEVPAPLWGFGMSDITIRGGLVPGGALRMERMLAVVRNRGIRPGRIFNKVYQGFDAIPEAFKQMQDKPRDLIKSCVII